MGYSKLIMSFFLFFFFISFASSSSSSFNTTNKCSPNQSHALLIFKQSLFSINGSSSNWRCQDWLGSGYYPIMRNWNTSIDCCNWDGVTCSDFTYNVIGLDLSCGMLQGTLHPNTTLFHLPYLQRLNLAFNDFTGSQLPREIGTFSNSLTHLNISYCGFSGKVPMDITLLHKLVSLDISWNEIYFKLGPYDFNILFRNFTILKELSLGGVDFSSVLPTYLNISSSLKLLNLGSTRLQGKLPLNIFNLQSLEKLDLSDNNFTGDIPSEILLLPKLVLLDLSKNGFDLQPYILNNLLLNSTILIYLWLAEVNIGGFVLPTYLNISSLKSLDLSSTGVQGKLPDNIFNNQYMEELYLSGNINLTGPLPKVNTSTSIPLRWLDLSSTNLSGEIPDSIGHLKSLDYLSLSNCRLIGSLPKSLVNLRNLIFLYLSSNMLSGTLPSSLFTLPSLKYITLANNMFIGNIPLELFSLQSIEGLSFAHNQLDGHINVLDHGPKPQTFQLLTNLTYIDLSANNFSGEWELDTLLSSLTNLEELHLSQSGLSVTTKNGNHYVNPDFKSLSLAYCKLKVFPKSLRAMKKLTNLDISNSYIHGHIPDWVGEIGGNRLLVLDLSNNSITGTIPDVYDDCGELEGFILNGNQLEGEVPTSLSKCRNLRILDLGNNHLNGTFPGWLGDLPKLESLVLKSNNFHGPITSSSIVEFPFPSLRVLDLSYNRFVGQLPLKYSQIFNAIKSVVKNSTKPEYLNMNGLYYSVTIVIKGVDQAFLQIFVDYTIIDLSNNRFEGEIPNNTGSLKSLKVLNLSHNNLNGRIPFALGNLSEIESLDLSWNRLTGEIPRNLADITGLEVLNLSKNNLVGRIPQGKQFNTFDVNSFGGNSGLCGFPLPMQCEHPNSPRLEGDGDEEEEDEDENGFEWKVVMFGYGCGTVIGLVLGYLMLSTGKPKWFNAISDAAEHMILKRRNMRRYIYIGK